MRVRDFLKNNNFQSFSTPANSWDSFRGDGTALMQLWLDEHSSRVHDASRPDHYMRVRCWGAQHFAAEGKNSAVGYAGRRKSLDLIESGHKAFAVISAPPHSTVPGPGIWALYADFDRAYPVIALERTNSGDIFVIIAQPVEMTSI